MRKKRFLAVILAASMVMGNAVMASAASQTDTYSEVSFNQTGNNIPTQTGQVQGTGSLTGLTQREVFRVVVPAQRVTGEADLFDFIMDPQGLINDTNAAKYVSGADIAAGKHVSVNGFTKNSLYFVNSANGTKSLSATSDELKIINKSTMDVDVSVNAHVTSSGSRLTVSADKTFAGYTEPAVYIGLLPNGDAKKEKALSTGDAQVDTATMGNAKEFYKVSYNASQSSNANGGYTYDIPSMNGTKAESENAYKTYSFKLTGTTNEAADWANPSLVTDTATVDITYNLNVHVDKAPSIATRSYQFTQDRGLAVDVDLGSGSKAATGISEITFNNGTSDVTLPTNKYNFNAKNKQLVFTRDFVNSMLGASSFNTRDYKVIFNDTAKTPVVITLHR